MKRLAALACLLALAALAAPGWAESPSFQESIYSAGKMKPVDSVLAVKVGDKAPDFNLPTITGERITLSQFKGVKNVVLTFVPAAWTPVCSGQWPGYCIAKELFEKYDATLIGITVDNIPTLFSWVTQMGGVWFPVASDFWPHGAAAASYGVLRSEGMTERALFLIDKSGVIRYIDVHDVNARPDLGVLVKEMEKLKK
jgi:peroxiredoxin